MKMDPELVLELPRLIMSDDPSEWIVALRDHCTPNCVIDNDEFHATGVRTIARIVHLATRISKQSGLVGQPKWDEASKTITYGYFRDLKTGGRVEASTVLHMAEEQGRWVVAVIGDKYMHKPWTRKPVIGPIYLAVYRPIFTWFIAMLGRAMGAGKWVAELKTV